MYRVLWLFFDISPYDFYFLFHLFRLSDMAAKKTCVIGGDIGAKLSAARKQFEALSDALRRTPLGTLLPALLSSMTLLLDQTGAAASAAASASATGAADASLAVAQAKATSGSGSGSGSALPASFALKAAPACLASLRLLQAFQVRFQVVKCALGRFRFMFSRIQVYTH